MKRRAAILGLGARGTVWAHTCLDAGWAVRAFDPAPDGLTGLTGVPGFRRERTISAAVERADWILCCLPERLELIQMVMQRALAAAPEGAVTAVATRTHDIEALQSCTSRPGQIFRLAETEEGGVSLDVTERNAEDMRQAAEGAFAELAAVRSLRLLEDQPDLSDDAQSA